MSATLTGDKELRRALNLLPARVYRKVVRQMTGKMATPIVKAAKGNLRATQSEKARGVLVKGLRKKTKTYKRDGAVVTTVGGVFPAAAHAHLVEHGHRQVSRSGVVTGHVPAKPFMRPAYDATKGQAMAIAEQALRVGVEREAKKLAKT